MCAFQVYLRPDVEDMTQVVDGVWRLPVSIVMRSASDGLMYELTQGWQLRQGQAWDEQVLLMTPLREVGPAGIACSTSYQLPTSLQLQHQTD